FASLGQRGSQYRSWNAIQLGIQLDRGHELGGTCNLEVHVAHGIFGTEDIGQGSVTGFAVNGVRNQTHGDTCNGSLQRYASVQQRQGRSANRAHGGRAVGAQCLGNLADCVWEFLAAWQHWNQCALCQCAVADFAALRRTNTAGFTGRVWSEVVVVHVALGLHWGQRVDLLLHLQHVQGGYAHDLGFATLEDCRTVNARQDLDLGGELTDVSQTAAVDADLLGQDALAHDVLGDSTEGLGDLAGTLGEGRAFGGELSDDLVLEFACSVVALLLVSDGVDLCQAGRSSSFNGGVGIFFVIAEDWELNGFLGSACSQVSLGLAQNLDEWLGSLKAFSHNLFGWSLGAAFLDQFPSVVGSFSFHHHDGNVVASDAAGNNHVEDSILQLGVLRESNPLRAVSVVNQCNANAADWAGEWQARKLGGHRRSVDRYDVVQLIWLDGQNGDNNLNLVAQALDEGWAQWAVHQSASQDGFGRWAAFAAEEAAWDASGCVHALFNVHGQWEEVEAFAWVLASGGCREQCGLVIDVDHCRTCSLLGNAAGFEANGASAVATVVDLCFGELDFWTLH